MDFGFNDEQLAVGESAEAVFARHGDRRARGRGGADRRTGSTIGSGRNCARATFSASRYPKSTAARASA